MKFIYCCSKAQPDVYTRVSYFLSWINKTIITNGGIASCNFTLTASPRKGSHTNIQQKKTFSIYFSIVIVAEWQEWGEWSKCSISCGKGLQIRERECTDPDFGVAGRCLGSSTGTKNCTMAKCPGCNEFLIFLVKPPAQTISVQNVLHKRPSI